jgi:nascent polypeptide-associated complex subunit beta
MNSAFLWISELLTFYSLSSGTLPPLLLFSPSKPINQTPNMLSNTILALSLLPVSFAHFTLDWPKARGSGEDTAGNFPCGGYNDVQQQRTDFPIGGGPLQLNMGHEQTNLAVYMAVGNNPGSGFSVVMRPQFQVTGLGDFCIGQIGVPSGVNVTDGTPASIQVVSNAHASGGLYQVRSSRLLSISGEEGELIVI